ncbi:MAG: thioredoxin domain-containing protein [Deltaproteobacteria bacterium]|nr:thioredoxin domain-containing protein [Deltaproteobacteria bacterium]
MRRWQYITIIILATVGVIISAELTNLHLKVLSQPDYQSFCNISERINCDTVNSSRYSEVFSVPIAHLGFLTYIFIIILAFFALRGHPLANLLNTFNLFIFIFCNLYSLVLFYISLAIIKSLCILCCGLYIVNLALLITAVFNIKTYFTLNFSCPLRENRIFTISVISFAVFALISSLVLRNITIKEKNQRRMDSISKKEIVYKEIDISGSFTSGNSSAPVTIVEISDFECPFCRKAYLTVKEAVNIYKDKVRFVFKHFPLGTECNPKIRNNMHPNACSAAYASVCAGEQNKFLEFTDKLMTGELGKEAYLKYAAELNLDIEKFSNCLESNIVKQSVARDIETCVKCQIASVPTVFINGRMLIGAKPLQEYLIVIEEELKKAGSGK